jgi:hypothetical protein
MKTFWRFLRAHPVLVLAHSLYLLLSYGQLRATMRYKAARLLPDPDPGLLYLAEGVSFGYLFLMFITIFFLAVIGLNIIFGREKRLYLWTALLVVITYLFPSGHGFL